MIYDNIAIMVSFDDNPFTSSKKPTTGLTAQVAPPVPPVALPRSIKRHPSTTTANETMQSNANTSSNHTTHNRLNTSANAASANARTNADNNMNTTASTHSNNTIDYHQADTRITSNQTVSSMQANATDMISKTNDSNADMPANISNVNMPAGNDDKLKRKHHPFKVLFSVIADICIMIALLAGCYAFWLEFWTGVESEQQQSNTTQSVGWKQADTTKIAPKQDGEPPVQPTSIQYGGLLGQIYIPRFGDGWNRNLVEGTDWTQLGRNGIGHYQSSALPGQIGLFAVAGHVNGYGQPLGELDKLQNGDYVIMRTQDYWYVYQQYDQKIVDKNQGEAIADVPFQPYAKPTERLMALTTCWPKYTFGGAPDRRVAYAKFAYWAKVSDGVPAELVKNTNTVNTDFISTTTTIAARKLPSMKEITKILTVAYAILFISAALGWSFQGIKRWHKAYNDGKTTFSLTGWLYRIQPGPRALQVLLCIMLTMLAIAFITAYVCPWAAETIPILKVSAAMD